MRYPSVRVGAPPGSSHARSMVYRKGLLEADYGYSTAVGLFNSAVNVVLLFIANGVSRKYSETSLF